MTIEESLQNIEDNFKKFGENMDVFLDSFAESLYDLKKQIKTENKTPEPSGLWKPKEGEDYWYIDRDGSINSSTCFACEYDKNCFSIGNCFKTQEEAEKALERLKIRRQLKDIAARLNGGRKLNWADNEEDKYYLFYTYTSEHIDWDIDNVVHRQGVIYCLDENFKDAAIAEIGEERLREYLKEC